MFGQGITTLFGKPGNHEDGGASVSRIKIQASFILKGEKVKSKISCFWSVSREDVLISSQVGLVRMFAVSKRYNAPYLGSSVPRGGPLCII